MQDVPGKKKVISMKINQELDTLKNTGRIQKEAIENGFRWKSIDGVFDKIKEELAEVEEAVLSGDREHALEEAGDLMFSVAILGYYLETCPSDIMQSANEKYVRRYTAMEKACREAGEDFSKLDLERRIHYWQMVKIEEKS